MRTRQIKIPWRCLYPPAPARLVFASEDSQFQDWSFHWQHNNTHFLPSPELKVSKMGYVCGVESTAAAPKFSYWTIHNLFQLYQGLLKSNPILTKSITSGVIACLGSSLSQVTEATKWQEYFIVSCTNLFQQTFTTFVGDFSFQVVGEGVVSLKISRSFLIFGSLVTGKRVSIRFRLFSRSEALYCF